MGIAPRHVRGSKKSTSTAVTLRSLHMVFPCLTSPRLFSSPLLTSFHLYCIVVILNHKALHSTVPDSLLFPFPVTFHNLAQSMLPTRTPKPKSPCNTKPHKSPPHQTHHLPSPPYIPSLHITTPHHTTTHPNNPVTCETPPSSPSPYRPAPRITEPRNLPNLLSPLGARL